MPGLRERKKSQTRERLMYAANRLFAERGFDQVTVEDVAAEADVSPRTFFRYFDSKAGVVFGAARDRIGRMEALLDARTTDQSVLDVFRGYWLGEAGDLYEHPDVFQTQQDLADRHAVVAAQRSRMFDAAREVLVAALRAESPGRAETEVEMVASMMVSAVFTALRIWHRRGGDPRRLLDNCLRVVERVA